MSFEHLPAPLAAALAARGYEAPTPVQTAVTAPSAQGRDLLVSSRTGSGKTAAFGLAIGVDLLGEEPRLRAAGAPRALVVAPTRELALQVRGELEWLFRPAEGRVLACVGGMDPRREHRALEAGCHIVVGTPGRLRDHIERGRLDVSAIEILVLDEADEMLDLGFEEELDAILGALPPDRRTLLFSATLPRSILDLAARRQTAALRLAADDLAESHADIEHRALLVAPGDEERALVNLLRLEDPSAALVFCATREGVKHLHASLSERGFSVVGLSGEMSQAERASALSALRDRRAKICVATDVAARGLDVEGLELVAHYDLPRTVEALKHRSGRTGRAGRRGLSVLLVPASRRGRAEGLLRSGGIEVDWRAPPGPEEVRARDQLRLIEDLRPVGEAEPLDLDAARALLAEISPERLVAAFVRARRSELPAPEELAPPREARPTRAGRERFEDAPWFALNAGRRRNADPRWLLPLICRRGGVTRTDVGAIRVFEDESVFQIAGDAVERFLEAIAQPTEEKVRIWPRLSAGDARRRQAAGGGRRRSEALPGRPDAEAAAASPGAPRPPNLGPRGGPKRRDEAPAPPPTSKKRGGAAKGPHRRPLPKPSRRR